jgi:hypothetical protein
VLPDAAPPSPNPEPNPHAAAPGRREFLGRAGALALGGALPAVARSAGVDIELLRAWRDDASVRLDFRLRIQLPAPVRQALERGVPMYFVASALLKEERWWWRDRRLVRAERSWRLAHLPLTSSWRVGQGGLTQSADSLDEALALLSRVAGWTVAEAEVLREMTPGSRHHIEFAFGLDTARLPGLMQIGLAEQDDWRVGARQRVALPAP